MLSDIAKGISSRLHELFGNGYAVYLQDMAQGFQKPCFFITLVSPTVKPLPGGRSKRETAWLVRYCPETTQVLELCDAADRLLDGLEWITLPDGNKLRWSQMKAETADGALNLQVSYNYTAIRREEPEQPMKEVTVNGGTAGREPLQQGTAHGVEAV